MRFALLLLALGVVSAVQYGTKIRVFDGPSDSPSENLALVNGTGSVQVASVAPCAFSFFQVNVTDPRVSLQTLFYLMAHSTA